MSALSDRQRRGKPRGRPIGTLKPLHQRKIRFELAIFFGLHSITGLGKYESARFAVMLTSRFPIDVSIIENSICRISTRHDFIVENNATYLVREFNRIEKLWINQHLSDDERSWLIDSSSCFMFLLNCNYELTPTSHVMSVFEKLFRLGWKDTLLQFSKSYAPQLFSEAPEFDGARSHRLKEMLDRLKKDTVES
jgi:hypothetical protein